MKVLFINLVYGTGSTGKIVADIIQLLEKSGHDAKVLYGVGEEPTCQNAVKFSTELDYYFHNVMSRITDHAGLYSRRATKRLIHEIKEYQPDLIHLHTLHGFYVNYEMLFCFLKKANIPVIWTLHDCWAFTGHCTHYSQTGCTQWQTLCTRCRLLYRYPQCYFKGDVINNYIRKKKAFSQMKNMTLTVSSRWLAKQISLSFLRDYQLEVIPNGVNRSIFFPQSSELRSQYHLNGKNIVLGVANAWNTRKGLNDMIALANQLGTEYQVVLIGLIEKQMEQLPKGILGIKRTANQVELAQWYSEADVFVNPTYEETFGMTTVEAQACGTPVVVYQTDGCPETIAPGNGILVTQGDLQELEKAVHITIKDGKRADPQKISCFDKDFVYGKYIELYDRILHKSICHLNM